MAMETKSSSASASIPLVALRGFEPRNASREFSARDANESSEIEVGIQTNVVVRGVVIPVREPKPADFTEHTARRNQRRRWKAYLNFPIRPCACGHNNLAHGSKGCEGMTAQGVWCECHKAGESL